MIIEITNLVFCYDNHSEHTQFAVTHVGKQSMILGYNWLHCKGNPVSLDEQLLTQDLTRGNPKLIYK
jgi:hypothetical protein